MTATNGGAPMDAREALARAMWAALYDRALRRPTWENVGQKVRDMWLNDAGNILRRLQAAGFTVARADARKGEET